MKKLLNLPILNKTMTTTKMMELSTGRRECTSASKVTMKKQHQYFRKQPSETY